MKIVGLDLGMGATKVWSAQGGRAILSQVSVPTGRDIDLKALGLSSRRRPVVILNGAGKFIVGEGAHDYGNPVERLDYERLTGAPEMQALVWAALSSEALEEPLRLIVGLPLGLATGAEGKQQVERVKSWLMGGHVWKCDKRERVATVGAVNCVSQAHAAYVDWMLDLQGRPINKPGKADEIGVISVGFNTVELLVFRDNAPIARFAAGEKLGVRRLLEIASERKRGLYSLGELDVQLRAGALDDREAAGKWASQVRGHFEAQWGDAAQRFAHVLVVGGGALLLRDVLHEIFGKRLVESDEPVLSVARGLYKLGVNQQK